MTAQVYIPTILVPVRLSQGCRLYTSTHQRHDEIRDLFGQLATEISHVEIEPAVLHLTGEKLHTRSRVFNHFSF